LPSWQHGWPGSGEDGLQVVTAPAIEKRIFVIRKRQVMLDEDLADLYGVETRVLVQQVKRNAKRFPADFMFQLTRDEAKALRSQFVISNEGRGGRRYSPYVFMELDIGARLSEHDGQLGQIFEVLRQLIDPPARARRPIGFRVREMTSRDG
jgi:hypothetical protein